MVLLSFAFPTLVFPLFGTLHFSVGFGLRNINEPLGERANKKKEKNKNEKPVEERKRK